MEHKRGVYNVIFVRCPQGDLPLDKCQDCPQHEGISEGGLICCSYLETTKEDEEFIVKHRD